MKKLAIAISAMVFAGAASGVSAADDGRFYVGGSTGYYKFDDDRLTGNTRTLGAQVGYQFNQNWALEASYVSDNGSMGPNAEVDGYGLSAIRSWGDEANWRWHLIMGVAHYNLDVRGPGVNDNSESIQTGFGVSRFLTNNLELRGDMRLGWDVEDNNLDGLGTLSLNYYFGEKAKAKPAAAPMPAPRPVVMPEPVAEPVKVVEKAPVAPVTIERHYLFKFDSDQVQPSYEADLQEAARFLRDNEGSAVLEGHTDNRGPDAYNQKLSERRAAAVKSKLVGYGADGESIETSGQGASQPAATNDTVEGRAANRRVEATITYTPE